jgi:poly-gamma-glutamate capsule biosynthesis protein CapA/YwtB (metallophosphatase superfamily)
MRLGLAGDTMLGRGVAAALASTPPDALFAPELVAVAQEADLFVLNLECAISQRGSAWPDPSKPFFFRAPPIAVEALVHLGVDCVTLANNHALDFGPKALLDTFEHLARAGIACVGAGEDLERARAPVVLERRDGRLSVIGLTDHPAAYEAGPGEPGVAYADLQEGVPEWLLQAVREAAPRPVLVTPHWGPNMVADPLGYVRDAAATLVEAGATLIAGHSAHVFHGVEWPVLYDLGDFIDDYAVDARLHNDLGLLFIVTLDETGPTRVEAVPLKLDFCRTRLAEGDEARWVERRFRAACAAFGTEVESEAGRLVVTWR